MNSELVPLRCRIRISCIFTRAVGGVVLARHVDQAREEAPEDVAAHEEAGLLPVAQAQDAHRGVEQLVLVDLEQLVARIVLQD